MDMFYGMLILAFSLSFLFSLYGTPLTIAAALKYGFVDKPDRKLKDHEEPVAYLGGLAIFISFLMALALCPFEFDEKMTGVLLSASIEC